MAPLALSSSSYISLLAPFPCLSLKCLCFLGTFLDTFLQLILSPSLEWPCHLHQWLLVPLTTENESPASSEIQTHFSSWLPEHLHLNMFHGHFKLMSHTMFRISHLHFSQTSLFKYEHLPVLPVLNVPQFTFDQTRNLRRILSALLFISNYSIILLSEPVSHMHSLSPTSSALA